MPAMASIHKEITINADPADVWAAVRGVGAAHTRLVPGLVVDDQGAVVVARTLARTA